MRCYVVIFDANGFVRAEKFKFTGAAFGFVRGFRYAVETHNIAGATAYVFGEPEEDALMHEEEHGMAIMCATAAVTAAEEQHRIENAP